MRTTARRSSLALSLLASHPNAAERDASRALLLKAASNLRATRQPKFGVEGKQDNLCQGHQGQGRPGGPRVHGPRTRATVRSSATTT